MLNGTAEGCVISALISFSVNWHFSVKRISVLVADSSCQILKKRGSYDLMDSWALPTGHECSTDTDFPRYRHVSRNNLDFLAMSRFNRVDVSSPPVDHGGQYRYSCCRKRVN